MFQILPTTHRFHFIPTPMIFNSTSTLPTPPLMPPINSHLASTPYQWLTSNSLKLNPTKTEAIFLHLHLRRRAKWRNMASLGHIFLHPPILLNMTTHIYYKHVRNLGIHIYSTLSFDTHIANMHKSIHTQLHCSV